jgi:hydroxymethylbilane synthase
MRIGSRASPLALAQAKFISALLDDAEIVTITTAGDLGAGATDKSRWVAEIEESLRAGDIDLAVHSAKDVPGEPADGLQLLGTPARGSSEDVLCGVGGIEELASGARVGTGSLRRAAQLLSVRGDLEVVRVAGNVGTRVEKLGSEGLQAIVLARAGLERLGREGEIGAVLDPNKFVPAPGQGALGLQARIEDRATRIAVEPIIDPASSACLTAERAVAQSLGASCHTPLGARASLSGDGRLILRAWIGLPDGSEWIADQLEGDPHDPQTLGLRLAERLTTVGARELLRAAEGMTDGQR